MSTQMNCTICRRKLNDHQFPLSKDCGGDCLKCMADAGDPDCMKAVIEVYERALVAIATTSKGYPNGSHHGQVALNAIGGRDSWQALCDRAINAGHIVISD